MRNPYEEFNSIISLDNLVVVNGEVAIPNNKKLKDFIDSFEYKLNDFGSKNKFYFEITDETTKAVSKVKVVEKPIQEGIRLMFKITCDNKTAVMNWDKVELILEIENVDYVIFSEKRELGYHHDGIWALTVTATASIQKLIDLGAVEIVKNKNKKEVAK